MNKERSFRQKNTAEKKKTKKNQTNKQHWSVLGLSLNLHLSAKLVL